MQKHHFGNSNNNQQQKNVQKNYRTCQKMFLSCSIRHSMTQIVCNVMSLSLDAICVFYSCSQTATVHQFDINRFVIKLLHTLCNRHGVSGGTLYDVSYSIYLYYSLAVSILDLCNIASLLLQLLSFILIFVFTNSKLFTYIEHFEAY